MQRSLALGCAAATVISAATFFAPTSAQAWGYRYYRPYAAYYRPYAVYRPRIYAAYAYRPYYRPYAYAYRPYAYSYGYSRPYAYSYGYRPYGAYAYAGFGPRIWVGWGRRWW
jgi:hypothetical protein